MSVLSSEKRLAVAAALVDGNSERAVERITGVNARTIAKLALLLGQGAARVHDRLARDLSCSLIEIDEIWSYVGKKQAHLTAKDPLDFGDVYTFTALDASSRMIITWHAGKRDQENTDIFVDDLRSRLLVMPQMTSDGFPCYPSAIGASFGPGVDYAQQHKVFRSGGARDDDYRTEQPRHPIVTKHAVFGAPDMTKASTSYAERQNGTQRTITGHRYMALDQGPVLDGYKDLLVGELVNAGLARQDDDGMAHPVVLTRGLDSFHYRYLDDHLRGLAAKVAPAIAAETAKVVSNYSHTNPGWIIAYAQGAEVGHPPCAINMFIAMQQLSGADPWLDEPPDRDVKDAFAEADLNSGDPW